MARPYVFRTSYDAACRMRDTVALHRVALTVEEILARRFIAIRLADGGSDGVVYDTRTDAAMAQRNSPSRHLYFQIPLERINEKICDLLMWYARSAYDNGVREDPAHALVIPTRLELLAP